MRHIICLKFCFSTQHPYFHPASLFPPSIPRSADKFPPSIATLSTQHPSEKHDPRILPSRAYHVFISRQSWQINKLCLHTWSNLCKTSSMLSCHKIATYIAPPCLMLGGIPPASLSEGWSWVEDPISAMEIYQSEKGGLLRNRPLGVSRD